jgi:tetratricopeptide (TPR) repeat protein
MTGRPHEGVAWVDSLQSNWAGCNNFAFHAFWHRCLFLIELGALDRVLDLYDRDVRPESTDDLLDISNAVALLWRLEQAGVDVGNRWEELADRAQGHLDDHLLVFGDVHYLMALAAAGRAGDAACMVESMERYAAESGETEATVAGEPGLALAQGLLAHRRGDYARAIEELLPVRHTIRRIGGSHAQRDLFEGMLIDSVLRAGRFDQAKALLADRLQHRPRNAWGWRHYAQVLDRLGDGDGAATARATAERLIAA